MNQNFQGPSCPWWRFPMVWMVIGGPALVVVASFATLFLAVRGGDTPVHDTAVVQANTMAPATQARNHSASPGR
jgi:uncharacterized protein